MSRRWVRGGDHVQQRHVLLSVEPWREEVWFGAFLWGDQVDYSLDYICSFK